MLGAWPPRDPSWGKGRCTYEGTSGGGRIESDGEAQALNPERPGPHPSSVVWDQCRGLRVGM